MIIYFVDRHMNILGQASTNLPNGIWIRDDKKTEEIDTGVATLECYISVAGGNRKKAELYTAVGNYILKKDGDETRAYTVIDRELDTKNEEIGIYAEDAGLDLLNEVVGEYEAERAYPVTHYVEAFAGNSGFEIGLNEIGDRARKLKWEGEATATERLASVATQFDAEISYSFEVSGLQITKKQINFYKKRGKDIGVELRLNRDIDRIRTKESIANIATALEVTGGTPEGSEEPVTLQGYQYDDGDIYVDGTKVKSREALKLWGRYMMKDSDAAGHITKTYGYDTTSQAELCTRAVNELKKASQMEVNYEVDISRLPECARVGDYINIVDDEGSLYLKARILKLESSEVNDEHVATLGEYLIKGSGVSQLIEDLAEQFKQIAGNRTVYTWIAYADDAAGNGITLQPDGKKYMGIAENRIKKEVDISIPGVFKWSLIKGEDGNSFRTFTTSYEYSQSGVDTYGTPGYIGTWWVNENTEGLNVGDTVQLRIKNLSKSSYAFVVAIVTAYTEKNITCRTEGLLDKGEQGIAGTPGIDGKSSYFHIKYSAVPNPTSAEQMTETPSAYIGTYVDFVQEDSADPKKYTWAQFKGIQGEKGEQGIPGKDGVSGKTSYLHIAYADSADGSSGFSVSDSAGKLYIGQYTDFTQADSTDYKRYSWTRIKGDTGATGPQGPQGKPGAVGPQGAAGGDGKGIKGITEYYMLSTVNSGITTGNSGWGTSVPTMTATNKYLWNYEKITYTDGTSMSTTPKVIGIYGDRGATGATGSTGPQGPQGVAGATGNGIKSIVNYYLATTAKSGVTTSTAGWTTAVQAMTSSKKYLWNYEVVTYTNGTKYTSAPCIIGVYGDKGATGEAGTSGIIVSDTAPPNPKAGQLWQRASGQPIQRWDGSRWTLHYISVDNLDVDSLSAITANLGTVTAGVIKNVKGNDYMIINLGERYIESNNDQTLETVRIESGALRLNGTNRSTDRVEMTLSGGSGLIAEVSGKYTKLLPEFGDFLVQSGSLESLPLYGTLADSSYQLIENSNVCVKKYMNGMFEAWAKASVSNSQFSFAQLGSSGLYYAKYTGMTLGITATKVLNIQTSAMNNGIVWAARPSLNANKNGIDGYIIQFGADKTRTTYLDAYVVGKWK